MLVGPVWTIVTPLGGEGPISVLTVENKLVEAKNYTHKITSIKPNEGGRDDKSVI